MVWGFRWHVLAKLWWRQSGVQIPPPPLPPGVIKESFILFYMNEIKVCLLYCVSKWLYYLLQLNSLSLSSPLSLTVLFFVIPFWFWSYRVSHLGCKRLSWQRNGKNEFTITQSLLYSLWGKGFEDFILNKISSLFNHQYQKYDSILLYHQIRQIWTKISLIYSRIKGSFVFM